MSLAGYTVAQIRAEEGMGADGYLIWNPCADLHCPLVGPLTACVGIRGLGFR